MTEKNIWKAFGAAGLDPKEVFLALRSLAGGTSKPQGPRRVTVGTPPLYTVWFSNNGNPVVTSAKQLKQDEVNGLVAKCRRLLGGNRTWHTLPMVGRFRTEPGAFVDEMLQIRTLKDLNTGQFSSFPPGSSTEIPGQPSLTAVLVDVAYEGATDPFVNAGRLIRARREAANLVTLLTWPALELAEKSEEAWTLVWDANTATVRNARLLPGFHAEEEPDAGSPPATTGTAFAMVEHKRFAGGPLDLPSGGLYLCASAATLVANYRSLPPAIRRRADVALTWFAAAQRAEDVATAITSYVTAIEALLPKPEAASCKECGLPSLKISKRFEGFLDSFAGEAMRKEFRNEIYSVRSKLSHGAGLHVVDEHPFDVQQSGDLDHLKASATVRAALLNWLLTPVSPG